MRMKTFFNDLTLFNIITLSTINVEVHGGGWAVRSLVVVENGAIGFTCMFFYSGNITMASTEHGREPQWTRATVLAKRGWCCIPPVMDSKRVKVWWFVWCRVWPMLMVGCLLDAIFYDIR